MTTRTCLHCGAPFAVPYESHRKKYCTYACAMAHRAPRDPDRTPGVQLSATSPHRFAAKASPATDRLPCVHYFTLGADGHGICRHCQTPCPHFWELDWHSHGVCRLCTEEHDFSTIHARYRGAFVHQGGE